MADDYTKLHKILRDPDLEKFLSMGDSNELRERMLIALDLVVRYGQIDGSHHKQWVLDQVARALTGANYEEMVKYANADAVYGPDAYDWNTGIAP